MIADGGGVVGKARRLVVRDSSLFFRFLIPLDSLDEDWAERLEIFFPVVERWK